MAHRPAPRFYPEWYYKGQNRLVRDECPLDNSFSTPSTSYTSCLSQPNPSYADCLGQDATTTESALHVIHQINEEVEDRWINIDSVDRDEIADQITSVADQLNTALMDFLSSEGALNNIFGPVGSLVTTITSSLISITSAVIGAIYIDNKAIRVLHIGTVGVNLLALVQTIVAYFKTHSSFKFCAKAATEAVAYAKEELKKLVMQKDASNPQPNAGGWLKPAMTAIVTVLLAGLSGIKSIGTSGVLKFMSFIRSIGPTTDVTNRLAKWVAEKTCGIDLFGEQSQSEDYKNFVQRCTELATMNTSEFVMDGKLLCELNTVIARAIQLSSVPKSREESESLRTTSQILSNALAVLHEKKVVINSILENSDRQETICLLLEGPGGHGKSRGGKYLAAEVAKVMGYSEKLYNLEKDGDFYQPYGGEDIAHIQEILNTRVMEDTFITMANKIISGDHVNLEGAALGAKVQPCRIKLVVATTNNDTPDLARRLHAKAVEAFWSRVVRVKIFDPNYQGRKGQENAHRKPDYSHLQVKVCTTSAAQPAPEDWVDCTFNALKYTTLNMIISKELQFMTSNKELLLTRYKITEDRYAQRLSQLRKLQSIYSPAPAKQSKGKAFFVVRIQGNAGTFKTSLMTQMAETYANIFGYNIYALKGCAIGYPESNYDEVPKLGIHLIDDVLDSEEYEKYLTWINKGDARNIYIIATNTIIQKESLWCFQRCGPFSVQPAYVLNSNCSSGICRRIGLDSNVKYNGELIINDLATQHTINALGSGSYKIHNKIKPQMDTVNYIYDQYKLYIETITGFVKERQYYTGTAEFGLEFSAPSLEVLKKILTSRTAAFQAYTHSYKGSTLRLSPEVTKKLSDVRIADSFLVKHDIENSSLMETLEAMAVQFTKVVPHENIRMTIGKNVFALVRNTMYIGDELERNDEVELLPSGLIYTFQGIKYVVSWEDYVAWERNKEFRTTINRVPAHIFSSIKIALMTTAPPPILEWHRQQFDNKKSIEGLLNKSKYKAILNHPLLKIVGGLVLVSGLAAVGVGIYKIVKTASVEAKKNSHDEEEGIEHLTSKMRAAMYKDNTKAEIQAVRRQAEAEGLSEKLNDWEYKWRTNSANINQLYTIDQQAVKENIQLSIMQRDFELFKSLYKTDPIAVFNALIPGKQTLPSDLPHPKLSLLDVQTKKILRNYAYISNAEGSNLALAIMGRKFVTVAHTTRAVGDISTISFELNGNPISSLARCIFLNRPRDLACYEIMDKAIPEFPSLVSMFTTQDQYAYIQCGTIIKRDGNYHTSTMNYYPRLAVKLIDHKDKEKRLWECDEKVITCSTMGLPTPSVLSSGDCGTVIMGYVKGEYKILGLHNGVQIDLTYFSSIDLDDIRLLSKGPIAQPNSVREDNVFKHPKTGQQMILDPYMIKKFTEPSNWGRSRYQKVGTPINIYGFNRGLKLYSKPESKMAYRPVPDTKLVCDYLPAATTLKFVTDYSELVKDDNGHPDPLWTQCMNFSMKHPNLNNYDSDTYIHAKQLMVQKMLEDFGEPTQFNLTQIVNGRGKAKGLTWNSSAGLKMKIKYNIHTKRPDHDPNILFYESAPGHFKINTQSEPGKDLLQDYQMKNDAIKRGIPICIVVKDNAKVELIEKEKAQKGKVRLFSELDLADNMVIKHWFGYLQDIGHQRHLKNDWMIGYNPYTDATVIMMRMASKPGKVISSDCKRLDKTITGMLIEDFVYATQSTQKESIRKALADSLKNTIHIVDGSVFLLSGGNESGSFITITLNCYVLDFIVCYAISARMKEMGLLKPSLSQIRAAHEKVILGDDMLLKCDDKLGITYDYLEKVAGSFNIHLTPAKTETEYSFCSRDFVQDIMNPLICLPKLKKESIIASLFYFKRFDAETVMSNCISALGEAAFWDSDFFREVEKVVQFRMKEIGKPRELDYYPQDIYVSFFRDFIMGDHVSPLLQALAEPSAHKILKNSKASEDFLLKYPNFKMSKSWLNEYAQNNMLNVHTVYDSTGSPDRPEWTCTLSISNRLHERKHTSKGTATTKSQAKKIACDEMHAQINNETSERYQLVCVDWIKDSRIVLMDKTVQTLAHRIKSLGFDPPEVILNFEEMCPDELDEESDSIISAAPTIEEVGTKNTGPGEQPVSPAMYNQAAQATMSAAAVTLPNAQPTQMAPAITTETNPVNASLELAPRTTLNPMGAPNMAGCGGITMDMKQLIYSNFIDCDKEIIIPADAAAGTVAAIIDYGPESEYMNDYVKAYARNHTRYTGAVEYRISGMGNGIYSGAAMIAWLPKRPTTNIVSIADCMLYAYSSHGLNGSWNIIHALHDARKHGFYREIGEEGDKPCLVIVLQVSIQNPLKEDAQVRIRVASKLQGSDGANPFIFFAPTIGPQVPPQLRLMSNVKLPVSEVALEALFPEFLNLDHTIYMDGNRYTTNVAREPGVFYPPFCVNRVGASGLGTNYPNQTEPLASFSRPCYGNAGWSGDRPRLVQSWPNLAVEWGSVKKACLFVEVITTVPYNDLARILANGPVRAYRGGERVYAENSNDIDEQQWDRIGNLEYWGVKDEIVAITSSDLKRRLTDIDGMMFGTRAQYKIITNKGTIYLVLLYVRSDERTFPDSYMRREQASANFALFKSIPIPTAIADNFALVSQTPILPTGYRALRITDIPASSITWADSSAPTATDTPSVIRYFEGKCPPNQVLQFQLVHVVNSRPVATVRYLPLHRMFVINVPNSGILYKLMPWRPAELMISGVATVEPTNDFPSTDTTEWLSRQAPSFISDSASFNGKFVSMTLEEEATPQAAFLTAMGGGMLSGMGQAMTDAANRKHQMAMKDMDYDFSREMFGKNSEQQLLLQANQFDFNSKMQESNFGFQKEMQGNKFIQEKYLQQSDYENKLAMRGIIAPSNIGIGGRGNPVMGSGSSFV
ncbi:hypothetical protein [Hubei picorna-like virus 59]|uniref:hypothetical protein n=1 Tax=Hubei picorna-like virus 59 TaxID=1923141 RepID=UPI00090C86BD|nr:hypothetical protein [Hubei picorna-like virus 59]APG77423.1 hypothetical protein [Hubei picorna-like virus 59]